MYPKPYSIHLRGTRMQKVEIGPVARIFISGGHLRVTLGFGGRDGSFLESAASRWDGNGRL